MSFRSPVMSGFASLSTTLYELTKEKDVSVSATLALRGGRTRGGSGACLGELPGCGASGSSMLQPPFNGRPLVPMGHTAGDGAVS